MLARRSAAKLCAAELLQTRLAELPDQKPPRGRSLPAGEPMIVADVTMPGRPLRGLVFSRDPREPTRVVIETLCARPQRVEEIDLLWGDADARLGRYELSDETRLSA